MALVDRLAADPLPPLVRDAAHAVEPVGEEGGGSKKSRGLPGHNASGWSRIRAYSQRVGAVIRRWRNDEKQCMKISAEFPDSNSRLPLRSYDVELDASDRFFAMSVPRLQKAPNSESLASVRSARGARWFPRYSHILQGWRALGGPV